MNKPNGKESGPRATRRQFVRQAALAALTPVVLPAVPAAAGERTETDALAAIADALAEAARARYAEHLRPEDRKQVRPGILRNLHGADRLRQVPLTNADAPAFAAPPETP